MSNRVVINVSVTGAGATLTGSKTIEVSSAEQVDFSIATGTTDKAIACAITLANLKAVVMLSDYDLTIKTNSSSTPQETLALDAGVPLVWIDDNPGCPFAGNVTQMFATNASGSTARLRIVVAEDVAP